MKNTKELKEIYKNFVGKGKVQALSIEEVQNKNGLTYKLLYREGNKQESITSDDKEMLEKILKEFSGKNTETCRASDIYLTLSKLWNSNTLIQLGHRITKIRLSGSRVTRDNAIPILLPKNCGETTIMGARKKETAFEISLKQFDKEQADFTLSFKNPKEFDNLTKFIANHKLLSQLTWYTLIIYTETTNKTNCMWQRLKSGDGSNRMVLELTFIDGTHYTDCIRQDVFNAAGDMFETACQRLTVKKKVQLTRDVCMFAAEDGKIDLSNYEAAHKKRNRRTR
jgi:hypothetical protein